MALIADAVTFTYDSDTAFGVSALAGVSLAVEPGDLVVVAGATGSGKSTLLRLLAGLLAPTSGTVSVEGVAPTDRTAHGRVGIVFQNPESQFFAETVLDDVAFGPRNLGHMDPKAAAVEALVRVGLDPAAIGARSPFTLSGGEARRVAIAGVLAMGPAYLLFDEPTAGLDAAGRRDVLAAISAERTHAGVVVVTHDPDEILATADRVVALEAGEVRFDGTVGRLLDDPLPYESAGLRLPAVPRVQMLGRTCGLRVAALTLDPEAAAASLLAARGERR